MLLLHFSDVCCESPLNAAVHFWLLLTYSLPTGQLDAGEFVKSLMSKAKSPDEEMREAWAFLDVDGNGDCLRYSHQLGLTDSVRVQGCINSSELKVGLERVGIHLAPWEVHCAAAKDFRRYHCLHCFAFPDIVCLSQLREMMEVADKDQDHVVSFAEYATAYGSLSWIRAQAISSHHTVRARSQELAGSMRLDEPNYRNMESA